LHAESILTGHGATLVHGVVRDLFDRGPHGPRLASAAM
jgi:hypothetical protein